MLGKLRSRLSYANVMATLGVFIALGGTAYAVNTVGSADIIDGEVKSVDIGNGEVNSADVKDQSLTTFDVSTFLGADVVDGTLTSADIGNETLTGSDVAEGSLNLDDIGTATVLPDLNIGTIPATNCVSFTINVPGAFQSGQLLLTPKFDAHPALVYSVRNSSSLGQAIIIVCNFAGGPIDDGHTNFVLTNLDV